MSLSRRRLIASTALAIPALALATPPAAFAATTAAGASPSITSRSPEALNTFVRKTITPSDLPSSGAQWYHRINTRVSGNSYYTLLVYSKGTNQLGLQIEKVTNGGKPEVLASQTIASIFQLSGKLIEINFGTRLPYLYGEIKQEGVATATIAHKISGDPLVGTGVTTSVYLTGTRSIDFREQVTVTPYDTPAGSLDAGPKWKLAFNEEFTGSTIDTSKWNIGDSTLALAELEKPEAERNKNYYFSAPGKTFSINNADCIEIANGQAVFKLEKLSSPITVDGYERKYKGGYIDTDQPFFRPTDKDVWYQDREPGKPAKFSAEFMRVEIRAKMPSGPKSGGNHACLWLRPDADFYPKGTPPTTESLEIDMNEFYGHNYTNAQNGFDTTERTETTVHFDQTGKNKTGGDQPQYGIRWVPAWDQKTPDGGQKLQDEFHIWILEMTKEEGIKVFYKEEDVKTGTTNLIQLVHVSATDPRLIAAKKPGVKMHLRLNFEAGTQNWGPIDEPTNDLSGRMIVDYVRAWVPAT